MNPTEDLEFFFARVTGAMKRKNQQELKQLGDIAWKRYEKEAVAYIDGNSNLDNTLAYLELTSILHKEATLVALND